ncbi:PilZ domain-containing protein [Desulfosediminicola ganghwensis]|uniref:PilZ domain-containing protein n=1 Tax=Desulfosediminicola ganghwensis TaxID=2569540 RepID=UPI0010ADA3EE|nr:PilZ domain-containing protein [Desulfosediminicola ganghwensis]
MLTVELRLILVFLTSLFIALFALPKLSSIALRLGLMDKPNSRKVHTQPKPLVGGIGMMIAVTFASMLFIPIAGLRGFFLGLAVLLFIGFLDDYMELGPKQKFAAQIIAACLMIYFSKAVLFSFGDLFGNGELLVPGGLLVAWLVTVFCVVGVINSVNLIDGLDGLAGGISFIAFLYFGAHASFAGNTNLVLLNLALAGAVLGFLHFNWTPAKMFMGDAGSLCLGFALVFMAIVGSQGFAPILKPVSALLILAVPVTDTIVVMGKRLMRRQNPFVADKYHLHHIFLRYGLSREGAVRLILMISAGLGGLTLLSPLYSASESALFAVYVVYFSCYLLASFYITSFLRFTYRFRRHNTERITKSNMTSMLFGVFDLLQVYRKAKRYPVRLNCRVTTDDGTVSARILNISRIGSLVRWKSEIAMPTKSNCMIDVQVNDVTERIELRFESVWSCKQGNATFYGVRFEGMSVESREALGRYIRDLKRLEAEKKGVRGWAFEVGGKGR